jgi:hypothetical protein
MHTEIQFADATYKERYLLSRVGAITAMTLIEAPLIRGTLDVSAD